VTVGHVRTLWQKTKIHLRTRLHSLQG
jgi:hypothetical protein